METEKVKVIIDKKCDIVYASFYILGLRDLYGAKNVRFEDFALNANTCDNLCFVIQKENQEKRYAISLSDGYQVNEKVYTWSDVYGSVNANFSKTPQEFHDKLVPLCPSFGIRIWNMPQTVFHAMKNVSGTKFSMRKFFGKYKRQLDRKTYEDYLSPCLLSRDDNYIFFLSTLWYNDEWNRNDEGVNARRARFIRASREVEEVVFEGGLVSQGKDRSSEELFCDCLCDGVPLKDWLDKTKQSALVFNTPAFWGCHGWKLGEYLAMGKCIVSTRLSNDLPKALEHGNNIHFVEDNQEAIREAVHYIIKNPNYRMKLEQGARAYWEKYGSPVASLRLLGIEK